MPHSHLLLKLALVLSLVVQAHAAHITDKLVVGLSDGPEAAGEPLQLLTSGTPIEVLRRKDGFVEVRLNSDQTGWVEAGYVTEEKPAKAILLETQARLRQMGLELAKLREQSSSPAPAEAGASADDGAARLQQALEASRERVATLEAALAERDAAGSVQAQLDRVNAEVRTTLEQLAETQGLTLSTAVQPEQQDLVVRYRGWLAGALALLLGFAGGMAFISYRIRRRYGGLRI